MRFDQWGNHLYTGERTYDIVGRRRTWYAIGLAVVVLSTAILIGRGLNLGIDFTGGSEFQVSGVSGDVSGLTAEETVADTISGTEAQAAVIGGDSVRIRTTQLEPAQSDAVRDALAVAYNVDPADITTSFVGPSWGQDVSRGALQGLIVFLLLVSLTITLYFRSWQMALAAMIALLHDLVITVGLYALIGFEVTPSTVIGFLTILGYSLYDTVVVFDKVRENTAEVLEGTEQTYAEAANLAVNQTLVRSINTSVVALLPVAAILFIGGFLLGAGTLLDLSLALFIGITVGTYSSIFLATPLLVHLRERQAAVVTQAARVKAHREAHPVTVGSAATRTGSSVADDTKLDRFALTQKEPGQRVQPRRGPRTRR